MEAGDKSGDWTRWEEHWGHLLDRWIIARQPQNDRINQREENGMKQWSKTAVYIVFTTAGARNGPECNAATRQVGLVINTSIRVGNLWFQQHYRSHWCEIKLNTKLVSSQVEKHSGKSRIYPRPVHHKNKSQNFITKWKNKESVCGSSQSYYAASPQAFVFASNSKLLVDGNSASRMFHLRSQTPRKALRRSWCKMMQDARRENIVERNL